MRTGVALVALATGLMRYFGLGWWTVVDGSIVLIGLLMVFSGIYYYVPTRKKKGSLIDLIRQKEEELMHRKPRIMVLDDDASVCNSLKIYIGRSRHSRAPMLPVIDWKPPNSMWFTLIS